MNNFQHSYFILESLMIFSPFSPKSLSGLNQSLDYLMDSALADCGNPNLSKLPSTISPNRVTQLGEASKPLQAYY
jgi:hypothetical protein